MATTPAKKATTARKTTKPANDALVLDFIFERATKNTYRFSEDTELDTPMVGTLYVQKSAFPDGEPVAVTVTITPTS